jgi:hypothetical protein
MGLRTDLHTLLKSILGSDHVYFQPPPTVQLTYPCIVYKRDDVRTMFADDKPYRRSKRYLLTIIDRNPDSNIPDKIGELPKCVFDRFYTADNLNHDVYKIFF